MLISLLYGFALGLVIGLFIASAMMKKLYQEQVDYYKKDSDNWFQSYLKMVDYYQQMTAMYYKEALKNITK